jgi:hypothetical protein
LIKKTLQTKVHLMSRPLSKGTILAIAFAVFMLAVIIYETVGLRQVQCEVCVELDGRTKCVTTKGEDEQQAMQTAKDGACSFISNGRTETIRCSQKQPTSVSCKKL